MRLVHANYKIVELCKYVGKGRNERFLVFMELKGCIRFAIENFADIKNKQLYLGCFFNFNFALNKSCWISNVVFPVIHLRSAHFRFQAFEYVLWMYRISLFAQLIVNCVAGRKDEKVFVSLCFIQVINCRAHQTSFTNTRCHIKAK